MKLLPTKVLAGFRAHGGTTSVMPDTVSETRPLEAPKIQPEVQARGNTAVVIDPAKRVAVPAFQGDGLRTVVQQANAAGLSVQPVGSGLAREQVPAAGTMVPVGTEIVVRFTR
jgi:cell division protein FtsI (penicillin-binding protein 3)